MIFRHANLRRALWGSAVFLALGVLPLRAQLSPTYEEPDFTTPVFVVDRLSLEAPVRSRLATILAAAVTDYDATLDAKILGIALRLDPANRQGWAAAARRRRGELPDAAQHDPTYPTATVVSYLTGLSAGLRAKGGADNRLLAGFLSNIAAEIDPHDPVAGYERTNYPPPAWTFLKQPATAAPEFLPLLKRQSRIRGLAVREMPTGARTGSVIDMIVTAHDALAREEVGITTAQPVGESMRAGLQEAGRTLKLRHPAFGVGQHLVVSFADDSGAKDGPSGDAAFTLLLFSLYHPLRLAADCAITGDITVDGRVRAVGAVPAKIHAALEGGCRIVAVPKENAAEVSDVSFLYDANTFWKIQVFTVDTLDEALAVMREDRPADLQRAIDLFAAVERRIAPDTPCLSAAHLDLVPSLREVLRLAPGHASAAAMLKALEGRSFVSMSLPVSWDEVRRITQATLDAAPRPGRAGLDQAVIAGGISRLEALRPQLDYRVSELCAAALASLRSLQNLDPANPTSSGYTEYRRSMDALREVDRRMHGNPALLEALRR